MTNKSAEVILFDNGIDTMSLNDEFNTSMLKAMEEYASQFKPVPSKSAEEEAERMTDSEKLRQLAKWFDANDAHKGNTGNEVQTDLRRIADQLEASQLKEGDTAKLQKFKDYVHDRLDKMGIPIDPDSPHKEAGCRIGGRLDVVEQRIKELEESIEHLKNDLTYTDSLEPSNAYNVLRHKVNQLLL